MVRGKKDWRKTQQIVSGTAKYWSYMGEGQEEGRRYSFKQLKIIQK
jgi:hypothetical protein